MTSGIHYLLSLGVVASLYSTLPVLRSGGSTNLNPWTMVQSYRLTAELQQKHQEMEEQDEALLRSIRIKKGLIEDLVAGRATFLQTAARFKQQAEIVNPGKRPPLLGHASLEEYYCRMVLVWTDNHMKHRVADRNEAVMHRLRKEFKDLAARPEGIRFPVIGKA